MQRSKPKSDRRGSNLQRQEIERPSISQSQNAQTPQEPVTEHHSDGGSAGLIPTTPNKRVKRDHPGFGPNSPLQPKPLDSYGMYTFNPKGSPIIDLTSSSPNGSPRNGSPMHRRTSSAVRPTNFTPRTGAKKLVVKNFRKTQKSSSHDYCNQVWAQVDASLGAIFSERKTPYSLEELYRGVENVCRQDKAESLYQKLCEKCQDHVLQRSKAPLLGEAGGKSDVELLQAVVSAWSTWNAHQVSLRRVVSRIRTVVDAFTECYTLYFLLHGPLLSSPFKHTSFFTNNGHRTISKPCSIRSSFEVADTARRMRVSRL